MASAAELEAWWARARDTLARMNRVLADGGEERYTAAHAFPPPLAPPPAAAEQTRDAGLGPLLRSGRRRSRSARWPPPRKCRGKWRTRRSGRSRRRGRSAAPDAAASGMVTLVAPRPPRDAAAAGTTATTATAAAAAAAAAVRRRGAAAPQAR